MWYSAKEKNLQTNWQEFFSGGWCKFLLIWISSSQFQMPGISISIPNGNFDLELKRNGLIGTPIKSADIMDIFSLITQPLALPSHDYLKVCSEYN